MLGQARGCLRTCRAADERRRAARPPPREGCRRTWLRRRRRRPAGCRARSRRQRSLRQRPWRETRRGAWTSVPEGPSRRSRGAYASKAPSAPTSVRSCATSPAITAGSGSTRRSRGRGREPAQHHRDVEAEDGLVAPIGAARREMDPRRRRHVGADPAQRASPARRRRARRSSPALAASVPGGRLPREPVQKIAGDLGVHVARAPVGVDASGNGARVRTRDHLRRSGQQPVRERTRRRNGGRRRRRLRQQRRHAHAHASASRYSIAASSTHPSSGDPRHVHSSMSAMRTARTRACRIGVGSDASGRLRTISSTREERLHRGGPFWALLRSVARRGPPFPTAHS